MKGKEEEREMNGGGGEGERERGGKDPYIIMCHLNTLR